ncbi:MAG: sigma-54-dependent Fis family transcriptional regulator [Bacteroidales bacterium]|nr:sigma-54-dependent Fis family transcriptional regulator [Bacteroidales bacterium]
MDIQDIQSIKQRFKIIGNNPQLNRAIEIAVQVAGTDLTVLINGESGTGKDVIPQIIHQNSSRKHKNYFAINCGAIPEGTIDSELFGHEKGSFTGAYETRKGYFEVADGGTIFLDEVGELPLATQARLLRVLENGEFIKVGSSKVQKTDVRIVAATNLNIPLAIEKGKFREDLYYRLNTVPIRIPALRERKEDIRLLFRKFAADFAEKYRMPALQLTPEAVTMMENYRWNGNVRQLKNITEQISIIENERTITPDILKNYLPNNNMTSLPTLYKGGKEDDTISERDLLYKVLFDMKNDIMELRKTVKELSEQRNVGNIQQLPETQEITPINTMFISPMEEEEEAAFAYVQDNEEEYKNDNINETPSLSLEEKERELICKALERHKGKRKDAAKELGISERTLYRKINEYQIKSR